MYKYFLPYDVFERHKKVGSYIKKNDSVVDIGGELNHLSQFCAPKKIIVANLKSGDVIISKGKLPFKKASFDSVCSIDVIEHMPRPQRSSFIKKLMNIASKQVILSFPVGTSQHVIYEKKIQKLLENNGLNINYLNEHIRYGLPTLDDIKNLARDYDSKVIYAGDLKVSRLLINIYLFDPKIKIIRKVVYHLKKLFNLITNELFYAILADRVYSESINRAYVIIRKK